MHSSKGLHLKECLRSFSGLESDLNWILSGLRSYRHICDQTWHCRHITNSIEGVFQPAELLLTFWLEAHGGLELQTKTFYNDVNITAGVCKREYPGWTTAVSDTPSI